ncbi:MAG: bifunctional 5,10-methylenetetrahydrofolate dehydrogenase/5,10-methenyltetrahydrofolate cyclohydrolase [bacterium]|nr:bifunctional 5,10-methylenetetrahydrofolate dehydrogenase/5,10-methenyltetrahydrofolate cyclohydrolase [bacterium]
MIDCEAIEKSIISSLKKRKAPQKTLAAVLVGSDSASLSFLKQKKAVAEELGVRFELIKLSAALSQGALEDKVRKISRRNNVGGVIVQLPLPKKFDRVPVLNAIGISKDIDVLNGENSKVLAPAAGALERILKKIKFKAEGKKLVVVGSGILIGEPAVKWLMKRAKKLTVFNKGGIDRKTLKQADLIVSGTGVAGLIGGKDIKRGAVVVDFGYGKKNGVLMGDIDFKSASKKTDKITPVPGGTGPIVVAILLQNFFTLNE